MSTGNYEMGDMGGLGGSLTRLTHFRQQYIVSRPTQLYTVDSSLPAGSRIVPAGVPVGVGVRVVGGHVGEADSSGHRWVCSVQKLGATTLPRGLFYCIPAADLIAGGAPVLRQVLGLGEADAAAAPDTTGNYEMGDVGGLGGLRDARAQVYVVSPPRYLRDRRGWLYETDARGIPHETVPVGEGVRVVGHPLTGRFRGWVEVRSVGGVRTPTYPMMTLAHLRRAAPTSLLGFGETDTTDSDFLSMLGKLAIPVLVIGAGVYIGSKLAKVANCKANARRRNRRRNAPFRVSYLRDFDALGAARTDYGQLPSAGYASVRDLGKAGGKLKGGGRWRTKLIAKRGGL